MYSCRHTALFPVGPLLEPFHKSPLLLLRLGMLNFLHKAGRKHPRLSVQQTCPPPIRALLNDLLGKGGEEEVEGKRGRKKRRGEEKGEEEKGEEERVGGKRRWE